MLYLHKLQARLVMINLNMLEKVFLDDEGAPRKETSGQRMKWKFNYIESFIE